MALSLALLSHTGGLISTQSNTPRWPSAHLWSSLPLCSSVLPGTLSMPLHPPHFPNSTPLLNSESARLLPSPPRLLLPVLTKKSPKAVRGDCHGFPFFSATTVLHCLMSSVWENSSFISLVWFYFILVIWGRRYLWFLLFHSSFMEMKVSPIFRAESYTLHIPYVLADATSLGSQM